MSLEVLNLFRKLTVFLTQHLHYSETDSLLFLLLCTFDVLLLLTVRSYFKEPDLREFFEVMLKLSLFKGDLHLFLLST